MLLRCTSSWWVLRSDLKDSKHITARHIQIVKAIADGKTRKEIASELNLAWQTIDFHLDKLFRMLNVKNSAGLVRWAIRVGVIQACVLLCAATFRLPLISVAPHLPEAQHGVFMWDAVSGADSYGLIVRSNGIETQRVWTIINFAVISNIIDIDRYQFTCVASNAAGLSDESKPAPIHWCTVMESDSPTGPWTLLATNSFVPPAPKHFVALSNWSAASLLKPD